MKRYLLFFLLCPGFFFGQFQIGQPARPETADTPLMRLGNPETREQAIDWYRQQGPKAVPGLLATLNHPNRAIRLLSLSAFQYAWSEQATDPVVRKLISSDASERHMAWAVLNLRLSGQELLQRIEPGLHRMDPLLVASVLPRLEAVKPDAERMMKLAAVPRYPEAVLLRMPRYTAPAFIPLTRRLAVQHPGSLRSMAIAALIHQQDTAEPAIRAMTAWLHDEDPRVREMAAEYFRWHGASTHLPALQKRLSIEQDVYVTANVEEAIRIIRHRATLPERPPAPPPPAVEPFFRYQGHEQDEEVDTQKRLLALRAYAGYPIPGLSSPPSPGKAGRLIPPVRSFRLRDISNYGNFIEPELGGPFANSVHVGIDVSWKEEQVCVVAIAPGTVRYMRVGAHSWGGIVVVEHHRKDGSAFCSLYSHLGPLIPVQVGDVVKQGQKVGSLGRNYTWESGGYRAHLHFGIHESAYENGRWITGYLNPARYQQGDHHWRSPWEWIPEE